MAGRDEAWSRVRKCYVLLHVSRTINSSKADPDARKGVGAKNKTVIIDQYVAATFASQEEYDPCGSDMKILKKRNHRKRLNKVGDKVEKYVGVFRAGVLVPLGSIMSSTTLERMRVSKVALLIHRLRHNSKSGVFRNLC